MSREAMNDKNKDAQVFKHTADKTKRVNIDPKIYRGGYRF